MSQQNVKNPLFRVRRAGRQSHWPLISEEHDSGGEVDLVAAGNDVYYDDVNDYDYDHHGDDNHGYEYDYGKLVNTHNAVSTNEIRPQRNGVRFSHITFVCIFMNESCDSLILISLNVVPSVVMKISHHWFRYWPGAEQMTRHYRK